MTFFYDLNKRLKQALDTSKSEHKQLNERDLKSASTSALKAAASKDAKADKESGVSAQYSTKQVKDELKKRGVDEGLGDVVKKVGGAVKKVAGKALDTLGHGSDEDMIRDLQRKAGVPQTGKKPMATSNEGVDKEKFAALAPPKDKITFADKIAGAKKEVDEMLGDVAAEAMRNAVGGKKRVVADEGDFGPMEGSTGDYSAKKARAGKDIGKPGKAFAKIAKGAAERYGSEERGKKVAGAVLAKLRKKGGAEEEVEEGWDDMMKDVERRRAKKVGDVERGAKHDIEHTATGRKVTRRTDDQGYSVGADDEAGKADAPKRGRGRPKGTGKSMGAKGPSGKSKLVTKEAEHDSAEVKQAMALLKKAGYKVEKSEEELDEKAVSKAQQRFMGMVHATQKGEKAPSKEVAKVAKSMKKSDAEDYAATKHKGLPEKKKPEGKKKEKTEEAGGSGTPTASSGFGFGKGIYDSINRELEDMIAESMSVNMSMNNDSAGGPSKSLTVTATDEDATYLAQILRSAGLSGGEQEGGCGCGTEPCSCGSNAEVVDENQPDWPTNTETSDDAMQYSGGLNKPKSTGQTTVPVIASQTDRQESYAEAEEDALHRMMEVAGIKKKPVEEADVEEGNKFTGNLAKARAAGKKEADLDGDGDMEKVKESILDMTNLWKAYKG